MGLLHVYTCEKNHHCFIQEDGWLEKNKSCPIKWCKSPMRHDESCQRTSSHGVQERKISPDFATKVKVVEQPKPVVPKPKPVEPKIPMPYFQQGIPKPQFGAILDKKPAKKKLSILTPVQLKAKGYSKIKPQLKPGRGLWKRQGTDGNTWYKAHKL